MRIAIFHSAYDPANSRSQRLQREPLQSYRMSGCLRHRTRFVPAGGGGGTRETPEEKNEDRIRERRRRENVLGEMLEFVRGLSAGKYHVTHLLNSRLSNGEVHNSPLVNWRAFSRQPPVCQSERATTSRCFSFESTGVGWSMCVSSPTAKNACCEILRLSSHPISLSVATLVPAYKYCISRKERNKRTNPRK